MVLKVVWHLVMKKGTCGGSKHGVRAEGVLTGFTTMATAPKTVVVEGSNNNDDGDGGCDCGCGA